MVFIGLANVYDRNLRELIWLGPKSEKCAYVLSWYYKDYVRRDCKKCSCNMWNIK